VLRGTTVVASKTSGYLRARGYIPRLRRILGGAPPTLSRSSDVMSLTKLNFNAAEFGDGLPVTLGFADLVGEILTAGPMTPHAPLPFNFYI